MVCILNDWFSISLQFEYKAFRQNKENGLIAWKQAEAEMKWYTLASRKETLISQAPGTAKVL